jgi:hypothetical protein
MNRRPLILACVLLFAIAAPTRAQIAGAGTRSVAVDTVVGVQDYFDDAGAWKTQLIIDPFGTVEVAPRLQVSIRPLFWRVMTGDWEVYVPQASVRYEFERGS